MMICSDAVARRRGKIALSLFFFSFFLFLFLPSFLPSRSSRDVGAGSIVVVVVVVVVVFVQNPGFLWSVVTLVFGFCFWDVEGGGRGVSEVEVLYMTLG